MKIIFENHKKKLLILIFSISLICLITIFFLFTNNPIHLKEKTKILEYGETLSANINDYINSKKTKKDAISQIKMDTSNVKIVENKNYPAIGEYEIIFTYKDSKSKLNLKVVDTTKPTFMGFKSEIEITRNCKPNAEEFSSMFVAEDLDKVTVSVDDSKVDYSKEGEYVATVKAIDSSKNEVLQDTKIKVVAPTIKLDKDKETVYEGESLVLKCEIKGKDTKAVFKSSDEKVATVNENGKVTAKDSGKATITATANGVEAKFELTVKSKPKNSSTEKHTVTNPNTGEKEEVIVVKPEKPSKPSGGSSNGGGSISMEYSLAKAKEAFNLQNAERTSRGLPALQWNNELYEAAKIRAKEITVKWSHTRPDGSFFSSVLGDYPYSQVGENLTKGSTTASGAVNSWMGSAGHKANILEPDYVYAGVAYYGGHWVTIFAGSYL